MDIKRIKELAGLPKGPKAEKKVITAVTAEISGLKLSEEVDFTCLARVHGATVFIKEIKGNAIGVVTFNEESTNASDEKLSAFRTAWKNRNLEVVVEAVEPVVETVEPVTESPIEEPVVEEIVEPVLEASVSKGQLELLINKNNAEYGTQFYVGGTYGNMDLWVKDAEGNDYRLESGSAKDCYNTFVAERFKDKWRGQATETPAMKESLDEDSNNFFLKHSETKPMAVMGLQDPNDLNDRMGINKERADKVEVPSDVKTAVSARIAELKKSIAEYDDKGYNDISQKEKAIECLEKIMEHLAQGNSEGLKQAQIFFGTLMSPITECFPAKLITFLGNADARKAGWLDRFKVAEGVGYGERRGMIRDRMGRDDMASELGAMGTDDDSTDISRDSLDGNDHQQSDGQSDDDHWMSSAGSCSFEDEEYEYSLPCPKCGKENSITPAHMEHAPDPACVECMGGNEDHID